MDPMYFLDNQSSHDAYIDEFLDWRMKTASGVLASRTEPHVADLLAPDDDGEWDTETFW